MSPTLTAKLTTVPGMGDKTTFDRSSFGLGIICLDSSCSSGVLIVKSNCMNEAPQNGNKQRYPCAAILKSEAEWKSIQILNDAFFAIEVHFQERSFKRPIATHLVLAFIARELNLTIDQTARIKHGFELTHTEASSPLLHIFTG